MSWELISSIMVIVLPADYLTATRLSRHRAPLAADLFLCKGLRVGATVWPLSPPKPEERRLPTGVRPMRSRGDGPILSGCPGVPSRGHFHWGPQGWIMEHWGLRGVRKAPPPPHPGAGSKAGRLESAERAWL